MAQSAQIAKVNHWHERLADWLIANPDKPLSEAAKAFNKTQPWISTVIHSHAFEDYFRLRSEAYSASVLDKAAGVAGQALEALGERLATEAKVLPINTLLEVADVMTKRARPAPTPSASPQVVNQIGIMTREELASIRTEMRNLTPLPSPGSEAPSGPPLIEAGTAPASALISAGTPSDGGERS
jgi:hypothetical protein